MKTEEEKRADHVKRQMKYAETHPEKVRELRDRYKEAHKDEIKAYQKRYRERRKHEGD